MITEQDLDGAHWAHLCSGPDHHAGGGAAIPAVLRGLAGAQEYAEARHFADRLFELTYHGHSGSYLAPAEAVVPHLVRIAATGSSGARAVALGFLVYFADDGVFRAESCPTAEGLVWRTAAALRAGTETYYEQLESPDHRVRTAAFVLLTVLEHRALLRLTGAERMRVALGPAFTSERYRRAVERLHEQDWDPWVRRHLGLAKVDPLFGCGAERYGAWFEY